MKEPATDIGLVVQPQADAEENDTKDDSKKKPNADRIYDIAAQIYEFRKDSTTGDLFAIDRETRIASPLSTRGDFRKRVSHLAKSETKHVPNGQAMGEAIEVMQGEALDESDNIAIHLRVAETSGGVWLDMCDAGDRLIHIKDGAWSIVDRTAFGIPVFRRSPSMRPLIVPSQSDDPVRDIAPLWQVVNIPGPYKTMLVGFLIHCIIHEDSAYPMLTIMAEQGSGKTSAMKVLQELIDPSGDRGGALPVNEEAFALSALNSWLLRYDNLSTIPPAKRDILCRAATGGTVRKRQLYTDSDEKLYTFRRPIILTAINLGTASPDLTERMVRVQLSRITASQRFTEQQVASMWKASKSQVYGALLALAARVQQLISSGDFDSMDKPRMADYGMVLAALDQIMSTHSLDQYRVQQDDMAVETVADEPTYLALDLSADQFRPNAWEGTSRALLLKLSDLFNSGSLQTWKKRPQSAPDLTRSIDICAPSLRRQGWIIESRKGTHAQSGTRVWTLQAPEPEK
jgi:hypothetical protein